MAASDRDVAAASNLLKSREADRDVAQSQNNVREGFVIWWNGHLLGQWRRASLSRQLPEKLPSHY